MTHIFILYISSIIIFVILDLLWLGVIARGFYKKYIGYLLGEVNWVAAIIFYALFLAGLTFFVTYPLRDAELLKVAYTGAFFGLITYATYDLTNHATVNGWPWQVTIVDMVWGGALGCAVSLCAVLAYRAIVG